MGSEGNWSKRHYDISMSKRTRKPLNLDESSEISIETSSPKKDTLNLDEPAEIPIETSSPKKDIPLKDDEPIETSSPKKEIPLKSTGVDDKGDQEGTPKGVDGGEEIINGHKSLKQLIKGGNREVRKMTRGSEANKGRNSLGQHFTEEEKQLQLVVIQQDEGMAGVKSKGMVSRYIKVLSHLIKAKRDLRSGSRKKTVLRLTM